MMDDLPGSLDGMQEVWGSAVGSITEQMPATAGSVQGIGILAVWAVWRDVMAARKQWSDLDERTRRLLVTAAVAEGILKIAALVDLKRRPASQVRGPKWLWATVVTVVSSAGVVPVSYFVYGRRDPGSQTH